MNMKMQQDISQEEKQFQKEALAILAEIKAEIPRTLKERPVRLEHGLKTIIGGGPGGLGVWIDADEPEQRQAEEEWWQLIHKLEELGAFTVTQEDDFGCYLNIHEPRFGELLSEYDRPTLLQRCSLELDLQKATLRYGRNKPFAIDPSSQPIKLLAVLLKNGEASYGDISREIGLVNKKQRDIQYIKRDLRKILLSAGVRDSAIENLMASKKNWGYIMRCEEEKT